MKNIVAFGASSSTNSINKQLAAYAAKQVPDAKVHLLDLNDYEMPIYSQDKEEKQGIPEKAYAFKKALHASDGIVISFAEHNSSYTAAFKNTCGCWPPLPVVVAPNMCSQLHTVVYQEETLTTFPHFLCQNSTTTLTLRQESKTESYNKNLKLL